MSRLVQTNNGSTTTEDKVDITDPIFYYFWDKFGNVPGAIAGGTEAGVEIMKRRCIRGCKDGFHFTKKFTGKLQRRMVPMAQMRALMADNATKEKWTAALSKMGIQPKTVADTNSMNLNDLFPAKFFIGREFLYPDAWYVQTCHGAACNRGVIDWVKFNMSCYVTLQLFRKVE